MPSRATLIPQAVQWNQARTVPVADSLPEDVLPLAERSRLMADCADRCRTAWRGQDPDWHAVDAINARIGQTFTRGELARLLTEYQEAILRPITPAADDQWSRGVAVERLEESRMA